MGGGGKREKEGGEGRTTASVGEEEATEEVVEEEEEEEDDGKEKPASVFKAVSSPLSSTGSPPQPAVSRGRREGLVNHSITI